MIGSFIGTQANVAAPPVIVLAILLVVMIFISFRSTKQGLKLYREEAKNEAFKEFSKEENLGENHDQEKNKEYQVELQHFH